MWWNSGANWICFASKHNLNVLLVHTHHNEYIAFYWALIGSDLLCCWVKFHLALGSLIFIFWMIWTLDYPDHSAQSPRVRIIEVWLYKINVMFLWRCVAGKLWKPEHSSLGVEHTIFRLLLRTLNRKTSLSLPLSYHNLVVGGYQITCRNSTLLTGTTEYNTTQIKFQIWPKAIVGAGSFWNYRPDIKPNSPEFLAILNVQHKVSLREIEITEAWLHQTSW